MIEAGMEKNIPYIILNQVLIDQIISSDMQFKSPEWNPTSLALFIPSNNMLTFDFGQPHSVLLLVPDTEYKMNATYSRNGTIFYKSSNIYTIKYTRNDISRTLTINGDDSNNKTIGDTLEFMFPQGYIYLNFTGFLTVCANVKSVIPVNKTAVPEMLGWSLNPIFSKAVANSLTENTPISYDILYNVGIQQGLTQNDAKDYAQVYQTEYNNALKRGNTQYDALNFAAQVVSRKYYNVWIPGDSYVNHVDPPKIH